MMDASSKEKSIYERKRLLDKIVKYFFLFWRYCAHRLLSSSQSLSPIKGYTRFSITILFKEGNSFIKTLACSFLTQDGYMMAQVECFSCF